MATKTAYQAPQPAGNTPTVVTAGTSSRTWITTTGVVIQEIVTSTTTAARPVVQCCG